MIEPYGSPCLLPLYQPDDRTRIELEREAVRLPSLVISSAAAASAVMLGAGYFTPLKGYMGLADISRVARAMQTAGGLMWPVPVANVVPAAPLPPEVRPGARIALLDPNVPGNPVLAIQQVEAIEPLTAEAQGEMAEQVFGTRDPDHPGVAAFLAMGDRVRQMLSEGTPLPPEFARPEVAQILMEHYPREAAG